MKYTFTDRTRKVLAMAREEAIRLQHDHVAPEHILLGLVREREGVAAAVLTNLAVSPERIRQRIEEGVPRGRGSGVLGLGDLPYTARAKQVLEFAMEGARQMNHDYVGTEHLLLGVLGVENSAAAEVLGELGVTVDRAQQETVRLLGDEPPARRHKQATRGGWLGRLFGSEPAEAAQRDSFPITIDDASSQSIYEQIIGQVREAIATGRLLPGERLPTVRRLAEELDIAPGTVARAYSELERLGIVVTEGARGTRVAARPKKPLPEAERPETLVGLLRPVAVAAFHLGASGDELRTALEQAMQGIFSDGGESSPA